jgi:hypothetical protein
MMDIDSGPYAVSVTDSDCNQTYIAWEGVPMHGRRHRNRMLLRACVEFGSQQVLSACGELDLLPQEQNMPVISSFCQECEDTMF